jgi:hypothetical protein
MIKPTSVRVFVDASLDWRLFGGAKGTRRSIVNLPSKGVADVTFMNSS